VRRDVERLARRACGAICVLVLLIDTAVAQTDRDGPLTAAEQDLLNRGEISSAEHIGGGIAGAVIGLGIGQALQGRWAERGWLFTLGEGVSMVALFGP
jgi:hypothetical protein